MALTWDVMSKFWMGHGEMPNFNDIILQLQCGGHDFTEVARLRCPEGHGEATGGSLLDAVIHCSIAGFAADDRELRMNMGTLEGDPELQLGVVLGVAEALSAAGVPVVQCGDCSWVNRRSGLWCCIRLALACGLQEALTNLQAEGKSFWHHKAPKIAMVDGWPSARVDILRRLGATSRPVLVGSLQILCDSINDLEAFQGAEDTEINPLDLDDNYGCNHAYWEEDECIDDFHDRMRAAWDWHLSETQYSNFLKRTISGWGDYIIPGNVVDCIDSFLLDQKVHADDLPADFVSWLEWENLYRDQQFLLTMPRTHSAAISGLAHDDGDNDTGTCRRI